VNLCHGGARAGVNRGVDVGIWRARILRQLISGRRVDLSILISVGNADMGSDYPEYCCSACKKEIKNVVIQCTACVKFFFHPGCVCKHKVYNRQNELVKCEGPFKELRSESNKEEMRKTPVAGGSRERIGSTGSSGAKTSAGAEGISGGTTDCKIDAIYKMIREIKSEMVGKQLIRQAITEAVEEEMDRVRVEIQTWKEAELESMVSGIIRREVKKLADLLPMMGTSIQEIGKKKSYSEAVSNKQEAVIIIKPLKEDDANTSEETKKDIKNKIDVAKLGLGITKMKKATKGAVVVGCENSDQAEILKEKVTSDMGEKYVIQAPVKKKRRIKIFDVEKDDCEDEKEFWRKIEEQNGFVKNSVRGKIVHKSQNGKSQRVMIIAEVDDKTHEIVLEEERVKIGWNICKVQDYIGILRCFKCCGYYHFAKDCKKEVACGKCAGKHATKECRSDTRKCVNCEEKIKNFKLKNVNSEHVAFDTNCPYYKKELEKQKNKIISNL